MRHLLAPPLACIMLAACAAPPGPQARVQAHARLPSFALEPGASVEAAPGVLLRFEEVEDSRCPPGVRCVWAGRLSCRFSLTRAGAAPQAFTLVPGEAAHASSLLGGKRVTLDEASLPAPAAPDAVANHRVTVQVLP